VAVGLGPVSASLDGSDRLGAEGCAEVVVDHQHSASASVGGELVRAPALPWATPVGLDRAQPFLRAQVASGRDVHAR
jgi:hypothetical protein